MTSFTGQALFALLAACLLQAAVAQPSQLPSRPISLVVPYGAGGGTDLIGRVYADELSKRAARTVVVENLAGAGGTIGVQRVTNAKPDGSTLVISNGIEFEMLQMASAEGPGGRSTNLTAIALVGTQPMLLVVRPSLKVRSTDEFVEAARARPGVLSLATSGPGTVLYLTAEMIKRAANIDLILVPYKSGPQIVTDLVAGTVDAAVVSIPNVAGFLASKQLVPLALTDSRGSPALPDVPSINAGKFIKGIDVKLYFGVFGPPGLPASLVDELSRHSQAMNDDAAFTNRLRDLALTPPEKHGPDELNRLRADQLKRLQQALAAK